MWTAVTAGAIAALLGLDAGTDAPAPAAPDLAVEIAWARANWPGTFEGLHFDAPLAKLRAWVARGPVPVYLFTDDFACRAGTLFPYEAWGGHDAEARVRQHDDARAPRPMTATIVGRSRIEDGRTLREVTYVTVDQELSREDGSAHEARDEDGRWRLTDSSGYGTPTIYGALSSVDDRVARWAGVTQVIRPFCSGPVEWLGCAGGGERPCVRCEKVTPMIVGAGSSARLSVSHGNRPVTCQAPCPTYPESPSIKRLRVLSARVSLWSAQHEPLTTVPSLYKSREDCVRDHPQIVRVRKR